MAIYIVGTLMVAAFLAFGIGRSRALTVCQNNVSALHSRPTYHGWFLVICSVVPALILVLIWSAFSGRIMDGMVTSNFASEFADLSLPQVQAVLRDAKALAFGGIVGFKDDLKINASELYVSLQGTSDLYMAIAAAILVLVGFYLSYFRIRLEFRTRHYVESFVRSLLAICSLVAIFTTIGIILSLIFESIRFFERVPLFDFLFGYHWSPQSAFESAGGTTLADDNSRIFGAIPLFTGTFLITFIAIAVAAPFGLMSAIYMSDYAGPTFRAYAKPALEVLAGIPTVAYGFFAALTIAPAIRGWGESIGLSVSSESALAAGLVMGIMIIPFVLSLSDDVINAVPQSLRDGSYAMGATKSETIRKVVLPAALPGIVAALLLAISRAVGETMIVVMAAGLAANLTINPLEAVTTVTVQIVTLLQGDQEFNSAKTLAAFALGLVLFAITLCLNVIALRVVRKYREQYD
ncbi:MAG: phosphate ABC transporter permease subunit PstC [Rhizobiaceae bacterium]|nr:phosphate ABC transporter permease subunit PstC [Rhizobiaceae bacterium]